MLKINEGTLRVAIRDTSGDDVSMKSEDGYLSRETGEIVFINEDFREAADAYGTDAAIACRDDRDRVLGNPDSWVKIPRLTDPADGALALDAQEWAFIRKFFQSNGIEAELT